MWVQAAPAVRSYQEHQTAAYKIPHTTLYNNTILYNKLRKSSLTALVLNSPYEITHLKYSKQKYEMASAHYVAFHIATVTEH